MPQVNPFTEQYDQDIKDKNGKILYRYKSCIEKFPYAVDFNGKKQTVMLTVKRLVTYNPTLAAKKIQNKSSC